MQSVRELAEAFDVREVYFDPWRFQAPALELSGEGLVMVTFPQSNDRMVPASERLYAAVVEQRLRYANDPELNRHVAAAVAKDTPARLAAREGDPRGADRRRRGARDGGRGR